MIGVSKGKCETLLDGESSIFLCETETFLRLRIARLRFRRQTASQKIRDCENFRTTQNTRLRDPWNLAKILWALYFFQRPSAIPPPPPPHDGIDSCRSGNIWEYILLAILVKYHHVYLLIKDLLVLWISLKCTLFGSSIIKVLFTPTVLNGNIKPDFDSSLIKNQRFHWKEKSFLLRLFLLET